MASTMGSALRLPGQADAWLVSVGHGATHWILATFLIVLPFLADDLGFSYTQAGLLVSTFYLSSFLANLGSGAAVDLTGRRVLFQVLSLIAGALAIVWFGSASSFVVLCLAIAIVGASNNLWHPAAISFLSERYPANRGYVLSIHTMFASIGDSLAPIVAGILLAFLSWRGTAALSAVPSLMCAAMLVVMLRPTNAAGAPKHQAMKGKVYRDGVLALLRDRAVIGLSFMAGFRSMAQAGLLMFLPLYLVDEMQASPIVLGAALMAMQVGGMVAGPIAGIMSDRIGRRPVVMAGLAVTTVLILVVSLVGNTVLFIVCISILGFALFAVRPVIHSWMMDLVPPPLAASGTSLLFAAQAVLAMLAPIIGGFIADRWGLLAVFYFLAATMVVANLGALALPGREPTPQAAD